MVLTSHFCFQELIVIYFSWLCTFIRSLGFVEYRDSNTSYYIILPAAAAVNMDIRQCWWTDLYNDFDTRHQV